MTRVRPLALFAIAAFTAGALVGACASPGTSDAAPSPSPDAGGAAGIQLAEPSGAPNSADDARRRAPEAVGSVVSMTFGEDSVQVLFAPDAGYEYFEGTTFDIPFSAVTAVDGEEPVVLGDLVAGDRLNVWTDACQESMPVQCEVVAVASG